MDGATSDVQADSDDAGVLGDIERNPAFHTSTLEKKRRFRPGKTADKTLHNIKSVGKAIVHPVDSIKSKATRTTAGQLSKADRPYLSQKADLQYLEAHDNLKRVVSSGPSRHATSDEDQDAIVGSHQNKVREIEAHRESLRAAWTTSRHVRRVRVVPKRHLNVPDNGFFIEKDANGQFVRYKWLEWLGYVRSPMALYVSCTLIVFHRILSIIPKTLARNISMISMKCPLKLIVQDIISSGLSWQVHPGNRGQWMYDQSIGGKTPIRRANG